MPGSLDAMWGAWSPIWRVHFAMAITCLGVCRGGSLSEGLARRPLNTTGRPGGGNSHLSVVGKGDVPSPAARVFPSRRVSCDAIRKGASGRQVWHRHLPEAYAVSMAAIIPRLDCSGIELSPLVSIPVISISGHFPNQNALPSKFSTSSTFPQFRWQVVFLHHAPW